MTEKPAWRFTQTKCSHRSVYSDMQHYQRMFNDVQLANARLRRTNTALRRWCYAWAAAAFFMASVLALVVWG